MNFYENIAIIDPALSDEEIEAAAQKINDLIVKADGEVLKEDRWGRKKLAYELNRKTQGYYILYTFKAPSTCIKKLEDFYKIYDPVFKYMVIKLEKNQIAALMNELRKSAEPVAESVAEPVAEPVTEEAVESAEGV
ncbi:MAG TPA: 30S ribosomal protein S6 [Nitrospirae bacterium]|nr:30S ribosomal protein S6 [Nitrospirota bacterium]